MEIFYTLLICHFIIFQTVRADLTTRPESVSVTIDIPQDKTVTTNWHVIETFLANQNVPVWIVNSQSPKELQLVPEVMEELGPFDMYWDTSNCATAVYFRKRSEFDAVIGHHGMIQKLKYFPETDQVDITGDTLITGSLQYHHEAPEAGDVNAIVPEDTETIVEPIISFLPYPKKVYIETLVIVDSDIMKKLNSNYAEVVSYVLSTFNMVDMLYSKIQKPKIRINIAGIIIGASYRSFPEFRGCERRDTYDGSIFLMDANCGLEALYATLEHYQTLPLQSYDIAVFITGKDLFRMVEEPSITGRRTESVQKSTWGISNLAKGSEGYRRSTRDTRIAVVGHAAIYENFPTIAHEIAHTCGAPHDQGPLWKADGSCNQHLMRISDSFCEKCLKFDSRTPDDFEIFFGSRQACILRNKPASLMNPQQRRLFLTKDEQCKCYGHSRAYTSRFSIGGRLSFGTDCNTHLKCVDHNNQQHDTSSYMNGTPCDMRSTGSKVCWNSQCLNAQ